MANNNLEIEAIELIKSLNLPALVLEIYNENISDPELDELLKYDYSKPDSIFELDKEDQDSYEVDRYKPIFEMNHSQIIAYDTQKAGYILYNIEKDIDNPEYLTWGGVWLEEVSVWWENEWEDDEIIKAGKALGLQYTPQIVDELNQVNDGTGFSTTESKNKWLDEKKKAWNLYV